MKRLINLYFIFILLQGCASTTVIKVDDPKAEIFYKEEKLGIGEATYTTRALAWSTRKITVKKEGCQDQHFVLKRNGSVDGAALITGILFIIPLGWIMKYDPIQHYQYNCQNN